MRDVLRGAFLESLILENGLFVEKTKILLFENALECTSGRHVGAFYWVNMHQIMRDILRGALMESLILENASFVEKMNILLFENAWKGAWWAKKQFSNTESFQKCPPLRRGSVTHEDFLMLRVLMRLLIVNLNKLVWIISRRNRHVPAGDFARHSLWYPWKGYEHRWCEGITWQKNVCNDDWDDDSFLTKRSIRTIRVFLVCYARGPGFRTGGKIAFLADLARFCVCIAYRMQFCEKRDFGRLRSCPYSWKRSERSFPSANLR